MRNTMRMPIRMVALFCAVCVAESARAQHGGDRPVRTGRNPDLERLLRRWAEAGDDALGTVRPRITPEPGRISADIKCVVDNQWTYRVYAPRAHPSDRRRPILFIVAPGGGSASTFRPYLDGAELNGWLLVVPTQAGRNPDDGLLPLAHVLQDALARLPVDRNRIYLSGFAEGARLVMTAAATLRTIRVAGILACGDTEPLDLHDDGPAVYGLCGASSPRRADMARWFDAPGPRYRRLEYFAGHHEWGGAEEIALGMAWLNAVHLRSAAAERAAFITEKARLEAALIERVQQRRRLDVERAYDWAERLTTLTTPADGEDAVIVPHPLDVALRNDPKAEAYRLGRMEVVGYWKRFLLTDAGGGHIPDADATRVAADLALRYRDSRLRPVIQRLAQPIAGRF